MLLGVNMQTSFMHPPFGFALFYLRSVAARVPYLDKVTGKRIEPVTTGQIYWGAVPFVCIQVIMVGLVIAFPQMVMHYKGAVVDPSDDRDHRAGYGGDQPGLPELGLPPLGGPPPADGAAPPAQPRRRHRPVAAAELRRTPPAEPAPPANDLSQPPSFN